MRTTAFRLRAHARSQRRLGRRDHNTQGAPRPRCRGCRRDQDGGETRCLLQECLGQGAGSGRVLHHRGPRCVSAKVHHPKRLSSFTSSIRSRVPIVLPSAFCEPITIILPPLSPFTKYATMINQVTPYNYPVPVRDDGNMPDIPSHPQDPQGRSLEWLKKL
ncbi:PREDICTED: NADH dehydrogenase [ubiquinone] 1 alpha subcomplex subunit 3 [Hipposideros armiger]|uniref:NADH dehydrogenase [ubiquinone] 1 alpha subcomplex subunit 3 n=1 Tax=Hipposideros armiger TaxID=186990 RepID=A0A8B7PYN8_HIPAR|nr:PREDICTED: NADH dehydrogenase [ubiquinone] 1 alpha subcomplex subunit 3 [Hipposideros armiger]